MLHHTSVLWWARWRRGPVEEIAGCCALQSQENVEQIGEGGSGKRRGRCLVLPPPHPLHHPPPGAAEGEEPCDRPEVRAVPRHSHCHPAKICKQELGLKMRRDETESEQNKEEMEKRRERTNLIPG